MNIIANGATLPALAFPYDLDRIAATGCTASASVSFTLTLTDVGGTSAAGTDIFSTTIYADADGTATLYDLAPLLMTRIDDTEGRTEAQLSIKAAEDSSAATTQTVLLLQCRAYLPATATTWLDRCPLSLLTDTRTTVIDNTEHIAFLGAVRGLTFSFVHANGGTGTIDTSAITAKTTTLTAADGATYTLTALSFAWLDTSIKATIESGNLAPAFLATLTVTRTDMAVMRFRFRCIVPPYGSHRVSFLNPFGVEETILFAQVERKDKPTRSAAYFCGRYRNYLVTPATTTEGVSFPLADGELQAAGYFLESRTLTDLTTGESIVLTDGELEADSTASAMPRLKATWRAETHHPQRGDVPTNIFDKTFDTSFD